MTTVLLFASAIIGLLGTYPYIRDTRRGEVRPHLVTWCIWTILAAVMTVSATWQHQTASAVLAGVGLFDCGVVLLYGWRFGNRTVNRADYFYLVGALIGIATLLVLHSPVISLVLAVIVDALAFVPTLAHAWNDPHEESQISYALSASAALVMIGVTVLDHNGAIGLLYPGYSVLFNGAMVAIIGWRTFRAAAHVTDATDTLETI